jgi:hypothetical protein
VRVQVQEQVPVQARVPVACPQEQKPAVDKVCAVHGRRRLFETNYRLRRPRERTNSRRITASQEFQ